MGTALAALLLLAAAPSVLADVPAEVAALEERGTKAFAEAARPGIPGAERDEQRRRAWDALSRAADLLRAHAASTPPDRAKVEPRLRRAAGLAWWIRRESPPGVLPPEGAAGTPGGAGPGSPPTRNPFDRAGAGAGPGGAGGAPGSAALDLDREVGEAESLLRASPGDLPAHMERWIGILARHPQAAGKPGHLRAAEAAGAALDDLKALYRDERGLDPDGVRGTASPELLRVLTLLAADLGNQDSSLRERAARLMGALRSGEAVPALGKAFAAEKAPQPWLAMGDALAAIGGGRAVEVLGRLATDPDGAAKGLEWLRRVAGRHAIERRLASKPAGGFALSADAAAAEAAVGFLVSLGAEGVAGLVQALATPHLDLRLEVMRSLAATGNPSVAKWLTGFLTGDESETGKACRAGAEEAIRAIGVEAAPYMFAALRNPRTRHGTGVLLRELTGQNLPDGVPDEWEAWWRKTRPDWKEIRE
jgi:hypothetical protein